MIDVFPEVYKIMSLCIHLAGCLTAECGDGILLVRQHIILVFAPDMVKPNAAQTVTVTNCYIPELLTRLGDNRGIVCI